MTLREALGGDVHHVHAQVDALLDREDGLVVLFDGDRMVSYLQGFGLSPCQLELLSVDLERAVRGAVGEQRIPRRKDKGSREKSNEDDSRSRGAGPVQRLGGDDRGGHRGVVDRRGKSVRSRDATNGDRRRPAGRVFRLARETAQPNT
jgi:hypothetical protein